MDPKSINNLDPKMKETYDRVMGTATAPAANTAPPPAPGMPQATPMPVSPTATAGLATTPANAPFGAAPSVPDNLQFQAAIQTPPSQPVSAPVGSVPGQTSSLLKVLYIIGSIVFFVAYTFFWIKIFNIPVPLPF